MKPEENKSMAYRLLYCMAYAVALLPFWVLYFLSDILYFFVCHVAHYRRKVIRKNLRNAFPAASEKERIAIERKFYRHLCDYFVETIKTLTMTEKQIKKRIKFDNPEIISRLTKGGNSCFLSLGHYGNWEWVPSIRLHLSSEVELGQIYQKIRNGAFNELFRVIRSKFGPHSIERGEVIRTLIRNKDQAKSMVIGFLPDQRPHPNENWYWTTFLNQDTPMQTGMERIARWGEYAIVYLDLKKVKRGYYTGVFSVITVNASNEPEFEVTEKYLNKLEETILREPAYYLWSHNRWKYKKESQTNASKQR